MQFDGTEGQVQMLREIAEVLSDPVFLVDRAFNIWYSNRAFENALGIRMKSSRYKGALCHQFLNLDICEKACVMKQAVETRQNVRLAEIAGRTPEGEPRNFHVNAVPVFSSTGSAFGALIFLRDITAETEIHAKYRQMVARNSSISLSGKVENANLPDILQLFSFLQKTGRLALDRGGATGEIVFEGGKMVALTQGQTRSEKALGRLIAWSNATFSFQPAETVEVADRITKSSDFMLMDALREKDELGVHTAEMPALEAKVAVRRIATAEEDQLNEDVWRIYEFAIQGWTVGAMIEAAPCSDARCLLALFELKTKGIVEW